MLWFFVTVGHELLQVKANRASNAASLQLLEQCNCSCGLDFHFFARAHKMLPAVIVAIV